ncbi:helix turn helix DNA binding protein [Gordonia phage LonelyBoi]|nr:helix turn helix DNA binding protein [Gordonia phage LonelyBoi]
MTLRFMSRGEIAEHLGVSLATVKQYKGFPEPDVVVGRNQGWARETVDAWVRSRAKSSD